MCILESRSRFSSTRSVVHPIKYIELDKIAKNTTYNVTIEAKTNKGPGEPISALYTSGPRPGEFVLHNSGRFCFLGSQNTIRHHPKLVVFKGAISSA